MPIHGLCRLGESAGPGSKLLPTGVAQFPEHLLGTGGLGGQGLKLPSLLPRRRRDPWWRIERSQHPAALGNIVEVGKQAVELFLGDWVVLVVVAARASHGEPEEHGRHGLYPVDDILDSVLLVDDSQFAVAAVVPIEARSDQLAKIGIRKQVSGNLLDRELIEGLVRVE